MGLTDMKVQLVTAGELLGRHRVVAQLGQGGMADVFLAVAPGPVGLNKLVVIKRLRDNRQDGEFAEMFLNEAQIAARLNHPNVIHLYEVVEDESQIYLVMEFLDGQPLQRVRGHLGVDGTNLATHLRILCDALLGLHYAHELNDYDGTPLGIVHRDMSPHNVFVTYEGTTKILDFGIAKALNQTVHTRVGGVKGKIQYMSPEQARGGTHPVDRRSDVFTLGILLWEAAAGRRLWHGEDEAVVFQRLVRGDGIVSPRSANPGVHPRLERICLRALSVDRDKRYATAEELRSDVEAYMDYEGMRVSSLDVGRYLSEKFSKQRESVRAVIDSELRSASSSSKLITIETSSSSSDVSRSGIPMPRQYSLSATEIAAPRRQWHQALALRWLVAAGLLVASVVLAWATLHRSIKPSISKSEYAAHAAPMVDSAITTQTIQLSVDVSPPGARVTLDDKLLGIGPFKGPVSRASGGHRVRAEAEGYRPATVEVNLESDSSIQLTLLSETAATQSTKVERRAKAVPQPAQVPSRPASKRKPAIVSIDTENPW
jgi:eukaryotic-like serine/threonine-protein kinase